MGSHVKPVMAVFHGRKTGTHGLLEQKVRLLNYCLHLQWIISERGINIFPVKSVVKISVRKG